MKTVLAHKFEDIISIENLLEAWREFIKGKRGKRDVQEFQLNLMSNILDLHHDLANHTHKHGGYQTFRINDPKPRSIHKATVRDRLLHHAIYRVLYPFFDRTFISDSFSCRNAKGTHGALDRFRDFTYRVSKNNTKTCWVLKCDIKKFFASIDQKTLLDILKFYIPNTDIIWLLGEVIHSFNSGNPGFGLPLGNLTSQLFANIYMNEFDKFVKHELKAKFYIRYADDFVILSDNKIWLGSIIEPIKDFLKERLSLKLHPDKVFIKTIASGIDFLGWVHFPNHRVLRTTTKRRMFARLSKDNRPQVASSYLGLVQHGNAHKLKEKLESQALKSFAVQY